MNIREELSAINHVQMVEYTGFEKIEDVCNIRFNEWSQNWPERVDGFASDLLSGSDYAGNAISRSNYLSIKNKYSDKPGVIQIVGGWDTYSWFFYLPIIEKEWTKEEKEQLVKDMKSLDDYPVLDEEHMSQLESEIEQEAWDNNYRRGFETKLLRMKFDENNVLYQLDEFESILEDDDVDAIFWDLINNGNGGEWIHESGCSVHIDLDKIMEDLEWEDIVAVLKGKDVVYYEDGIAKNFKGGWKDTATKPLFN